MLKSYNFFVEESHIIEKNDCSKIFEWISKNEPCCIRRIIQENLNLDKDGDEYIQEKIDTSKTIELKRLLNRNTAGEIFRD